MVQIRKKTPAKKSKTNTQPSLQKREIISIHQLSKIAMTFWLGGTWMAGIVIFPILFNIQYVCIIQFCTLVIFLLLIILSLFYDWQTNSLS